MSSRKRTSKYYLQLVVSREDARIIKTALLVSADKIQSLIRNYCSLNCPWEPLPGKKRLVRLLDKEKNYLIKMHNDLHHRIVNAEKTLNSLDSMLKEVSKDNLRKSAKSADKTSEKELDSRFRGNDGADQCPNR
jgi:2-polyprenyl-6-methoxyphenol hydroxylase-like FAD-dependent oxidoreductase